eukprot:s2624_g7.t1
MGDFHRIDDGPMELSPGSAAWLSVDVPGRGHRDSGDMANAKVWLRSGALLVLASIATLAPSNFLTPSKTPVRGPPPRRPWQPDVLCVRVSCPLEDVLCGLGEEVRATWRNWASMGMFQLHNCKLPVRAGRSYCKLAVGNSATR